MFTRTLFRSVAASVAAISLTAGSALAADAPAPAPVTEIQPVPPVEPAPVKPFDPNATGPDKVEIDPVEAGEPGVIVVEAEAEAVPVEMKKVAFIGVGSQSLDPAAAADLNLPEGVGLEVVVVMPDTPAAAAGLQVGDILHKLNDQILVNPEQMRTLIRIHKPGDEVAVTVIRDGKPVALKAKLIEREVPVFEPNDVFELAPGAHVHPIGPGQRIHVGPNGLIEIRPLDIQPGQPVDPEQLRKQVEKQVLELRKQIEQNGGQGGILVPGGAPGVQGNANASATVAMSDNEHNIKYSINNGDKHLTATDKAGKVLFDGPVNTEEQRKAIPAGVREKFDKLEKQTNLNIRIMPDPFVPQPQPEPEDPAEVLG